MIINGIEYTCPKCGSLKVRSRGKTAKQLRFDCRDCKHRPVFSSLVKLANAEIVAENISLAKQKQKQQDMNRIKNKSFHEPARIENTIIELDNWGWWAQEDDTRKLNYTSGSIFSGQLLCGRSIKITDDRAMQLDRAIASLSKHLKRIVRLRFICGFDPHRLSMALDITEEQASEMISNSVVLVHEYLIEKMVT